MTCILRRRSRGYHGPNELSGASHSSRRTGPRPAQSKIGFVPSTSTPGRSPPNWLCSAVSPRHASGHVPDLPSPKLGSFGHFQIGFVPSFCHPPSWGRIPSCWPIFNRPRPAPGWPAGSTAPIGFVPSTSARPPQIGFVSQFVDGTPGPRPRPSHQPPRKPPLLKLKQHTCYDHT